MNKPEQEPPVPETDRVVTVLSVSADENQHADLRALFRHSNWVLLEARSCRDALGLLARIPIAVMVCDAVLPDGHWKEFLDIRERAPAVIVASHKADDRLWANVLESGGYNVVAKPFHRADVFYTISHAWRQWKGRFAPGNQRALMAAG